MAEACRDWSECLDEAGCAALGGCYRSVAPASDPRDARIAELTAEVERLRVGHDRYETVRRMNVPMFKDAILLNRSTGKPFDEIIDDLRPFVFPPAPSTQEAG